VTPMTDTTLSSASPAKVLAWDLPTRLFKWALVVCIAVAWASDKLGGGNPTVHVTNGRIVLTLVVFRILWGFVGTAHARFTDFVPGPARLIAYLRAMLAGREPRHVGHNPAASVMILTLMALLAAVSLTGWMLTLDAYFGEEWLEELHELIANAILGLAVIHVLAAIYESMRHRENLILAMITGRKRL